MDEHVSFSDLPATFDETVRQMYKKYIRSPNVRHQLFMTRALLGEQLFYLYTAALDCCCYYIHVKINQDLYGGIFAFWSEKRPDTMFIQGITKMSTSAINDLFALERNIYLNEILDKPIQDLAKSLGAQRILVAPVGNQKRINLGNVLQL